MERGHGKKTIIMRSRFFFFAPYNMKAWNRPASLNHLRIKFYICTPKKLFLVINTFYGIKDCLLVFLRGTALPIHCRKKSCTH